MKPNWIKLTGRFTPNCLFYTAEALNTGLKPFSIPVKTIYLAKGERGEVYFQKEKCQEYAQKFIEKARQDPHFVSRFFSEHRQVALQTQQSFRRFVNLKERTNSELSAMFRQHYQLMVKRSRYENSTELVTISAEEELKKKLKEIGAEERFLDLALTTKESYLREEEKELLLILQEIQNNPKLKNKFKENLNQFPEIEKRISQHQQKWFWIRNTWIEHSILKESFFIDELQKLLDDNVGAKEKLSEMREFLEQAKRDKEKTIRELKLDPETINLINLIDDYVHLQDYRKKIRMEEIHYYYSLLEDIGKRNGYSLPEMRFTTVEEAVNLFQEKVDKEIIKERQKFCVQVMVNHKLVLLTGKEAEEVMAEWLGGKEEVQNITEAKGMPAHPGKIKGRAKILLSPHESRKLNPGEILIAENTTPEFIVAMKKAGAIVTERGGVICHAAIVSRELGRPCIVGVNDVTRIFKDNDLVEVDAHKGIIKKAESL